MATTILAKNIDFAPKRISHEAIIFYNLQFCISQVEAGCTK